MTSQLKRVLVMDDEEIVADIAQQMLSHLGYEVDVVKDGKEAVAAYKEAYENGNPFALVIMDLNIPGGMGGVDAVQEVLKIDENARVAVSTGYSSDTIVGNYTDYGFCGCINKPFDLNGLKKSVEDIINP